LFFWGSWLKPKNQTAIRKLKPSKCLKQSILTKKGNLYKDDGSLNVSWDTKLTVCFCFLIMSGPRGFRSMRTPRITKPQILSPKITQKQGFRSCFSLTNINRSIQRPKRIIRWKFLRNSWHLWWIFRYHAKLIKFFIRIFLLLQIPLP